MVENQGRNIAGMSITVANEAAAFGRFIDRRLEHPEVLFGAAEAHNGFGHDSTTAFPMSKP
jgi:hypothetical protein